MSDAELRKEIQKYEPWDITDKEWKREGRSHWEMKAEEYGIGSPLPKPRKGAGLSSLERKKMILEDVVDDLQKSESTLNGGAGNELYYSPKDDDIEDAQYHIQDAITRIEDSKLWADGEKEKFKKKRPKTRLV